MTLTSSLDATGNMWRGRRCLPSKITLPSGRGNGPRPIALPPSVLVLPPSSLPVVVAPAYQVHFASCPYADQIRRHRDKRPGADEPRVVCKIWRQPLHPLNVAAGVVVHPCCEEW